MFGLTPGGDEEESTSHSEYADKWRQLSSDDVRGVEQAAMEQDEPGDGRVVDECPAASSDEADEPATLRQYPSRFRKPPKTFTYN
uniref:Uncharacterized protein n=1 Tax=Knipowitschia caucasica TaxID=637954 RepID=A0AAV2IZM1_KNICA